MAISIFCFLLICLISIVFHSLLLGISPMPSSKKAKMAMLAQVPLQKGVIYELGSGWGGLAQLVAKHRPAAQVIAFELSPIPYLFSRITQWIIRRPNLTLIRKDFHIHNLSNATTVLCYLYSGGMKKLNPKFKQELSDKCTIISNTFALRGWEDETLLFLDDLSFTRIYKYRVPVAKK